jgi:hypothetical protein
MSIEREISEIYIILKHNGKMILSQILKKRGDNKPDTFFFLKGGR